MSIYQCEVCGFIYDESKGLELEGIASGTKWDSIDLDWICPDCGVKKNRFKKK
jgi:rubredoxin